MVVLAWGWGAAGGQFSGARCFDLMQKIGRGIEVITANHPFRVLALPGPCCSLQAQEWRSICFCSAEISRTRVQVLYLLYNIVCSTATAESNVFGA